MKKIRQKFQCCKTLTLFAIQFAIRQEFVLTSGSLFLTNLMIFTESSSSLMSSGSGGRSGS